jgi:hypothetical protein
MDEDGEALKTFLDSVLQSQTSADDGWRNLGLGFGLYFLAMLESGLEIPHALQLTATYQAATLSAFRARGDAR